MPQFDLCPYCLEPLEGGAPPVCPHCGKNLRNRNPEGALPLGAQLGGRYTVGDYLSADGDGPFLPRGGERRAALCAY